MIDRFDVTPKKGDPWGVVRGSAPATSDIVFKPIVRAETPRLGFPERISFDQEVIRGALENLQYAPDTLAGAAKFIPGVRGLGDLLGNVGRAAEQLPVLPQVGGFISDAAKSTVEAAFGRAGTVLGEVGRTFDTEDPTPIPLKVLNAPQRLGLTAVLGKTGTTLSSGGKLDWNDVPKDILDTIAIASVVPAMKVAGLIGKAATGGSTAAQIARGFASPFERSLAPSTAENFARLAGRVTAGAYGAGLATRVTLPHVAGNEWWAKEILQDRILPEDNKWRFPMDMALSLPLDLVALTRLTATSRQSAWAARKIFGATPPPLALKFPDYERSVGTTISRDNWGWVNRKLIEDAAADRLIDSLNAAIPEGQRIPRGQWQKAAEMRGETPEAFKRSVVDEMDRMFAALGPRQVHELAAQQLDRWASTPGLTPGGLLQLADEYADWARMVEPANPGKVLAVDDFLHARQAPLAVNYLDSISEWGPKQHAQFKRRFPALADSLDKGSGYLTNKPAWREYVKTFMDDATPTPPAKMGTLLAQLDDLDDRIYHGEKLGAARTKVASEIADLRREVSEGYKKELETLQVSRQLREAELQTKDLSDIERQAVMEDLARMDEAISKANEDYYNLGVMAGGRWHLETPPTGPVMRVSDEPLYKGLNLTAKRTNMGKVFDALFGDVRNADMGREAMQSMMDTGARAGVSGSEMEEFMTLLRDRIEEGTFTVGSAATFRLFASVWHLPPWMVNNIARNFKRANGSVGLPLPKGSTWSEAIYRAYPGPFNIFARRFGKELPELKYNEAFHAVSRALYGTFRFTLDPRFILLNFGEPHIIRQALARTGEVDESTVTRLTHMIERIQDEVKDTGALDLSGRARSVALYAWSRRPDEFTRAYLPILRKQPEMQKILQQYGVKNDADFVQFLDDTMRERFRLLDDTAASTEAEKKLKSELAAAKKNLKAATGDGEQSLHRAEVDRLQTDLALERRRGEFLEEAEKTDWRPELQPALDVMMQVDQKVTRDAIEKFRGNPDRSAAERLLNSYLLYWPISYQIKAGKLLFEFMFSKGLGFRSGSAGAQAWLKVRRDHERKLEEDPEYASFFEKNNDLLFLFQMLIPLTPEDVGVSLSPFTRIPLKIARGEAPATIAKRTFNQGPVYTFGDLLPKLMAEQTKPGGMLYDLLEYTEGR